MHVNHKNTLNTINNTSIPRKSIVGRNDFWEKHVVIFTAKPFSLVLKHGYAMKSSNIISSYFNIAADDVRGT